MADAKREDYYHGLNVNLFRAVPPGAKAIMEVGCGEGRLGALLKERSPDGSRTVIGVELNASVAERARQRLDQVFCLDLEGEDPPLEAGSLDCILYGDVLEHLVDPRRVLARHRKLLKPDGQILCSIPNIQHHSILTALARGDFQYVEAGLLDSTHLRFFSYSTFSKLLLDAGFRPEWIDTLAAPADEKFSRSIQPFLARTGVDPERTRRYLDAYQFIFRGRLAPGWKGDVERGDRRPMTFVAAVSSEEVLQANLKASPCLGPSSAHELLTFRDCASAAEAFHQGLARARHDLVVWVHQDVYLPRGWDVEFAEKVEEVRRSGPLGVVGTYGVRGEGGVARGVGTVLDRDRMLVSETPLPCRVDTLDELLLAVGKDTPLRFDPAFGFHLYGADVCMSAGELGLAAHVVDATCFHNSTLPYANPPELERTAVRFARKWRRRLPVATPCMVIGEQHLHPRDGRGRGAGVVRSLLAKLGRRARS